MQKRLQVLVIHGAGPQKSDFDHTFRQELVKYLDKKGPKACKGRWTDLIQFRTVLYAPIGDFEKRDLWRRIYPEKPGFWGFGGVRERIYDPISDLLYYQSTKGGREIRNTLRTEVTAAGHELRQDDPDWPMTPEAWQALGREQAAAKWIETPAVYITIVAHSMGTLVSYDVAYGYAQEIEQMFKYFQGELDSFNWPPVCCYKIGLLNYYTTGSPLAFFALQRPDARGRTEAHIERPPVLDHETGEWVNFLDPQDVAAYPLEGVYDPEVVQKAKLRDQATKRDFDPLSAHDYWDDDVVIETIGQKMIQDYYTLVESKPTDE